VYLAGSSFLIELGLKSEGVDVKAIFYYFNL